METILKSDVIKEIDEMIRLNEEMSKQLYQKDLTDKIIYASKIVALSDLKNKILNS